MKNKKGVLPTVGVLYTLTWAADIIPHFRGYVKGADRDTGSYISFFRFFVKRMAPAGAGVNGWRRRVVVNPEPAEGFPSAAKACQRGIAPLVPPLPSGSMSVSSSYRRLRVEKSSKTRFFQRVNGGLAFFSVIEATHLTK